MEYFFSEKKLERTLGTGSGRFSGTISLSILTLESLLPVFAVIRVRYCMYGLYRTVHGAAVR